MMTTNNLLLIKKGDVIEENILKNTPYTFTPTSAEPLDCVVLLFNEGVDVTIDLKEEESSCSIKVLYLANHYYIFTFIDFINYIIKCKFR